MSDSDHFSLNLSNTNKNPLNTWCTCNNSFYLNRENLSQAQAQYSGSKYRIRTKKEKEYLQEVWSVQQIPLDFEGISKPSAIVEKVLQSRKDDYDVALESFENELGSLHEACEADVSDLDKNLQIEIEKYHSDIEDEKDTFCNLECMNDEKYSELRDKIEPIMEKEQIAIDRFLESIREIEYKKRSRVTQIFKKYHLILKKLFYLQKDELRKLMEMKITEYNHAAIEKHKKCEELKLKLRSSADTYKQNFYLWIKEMKEDRKAVCRKNILNEFYIDYDNFQNAGAVYFKIIEGKAALCRLKSRKNIISDTIVQWDVTVPFSVSRFEKQSNQFDSIISSTDSTVTSFIKSYKFYMSRHLSRLSNKIEKLKTLSIDNNEMPDQEIEVSQKIYDRAKDKIEYFIVELEDTWNQILNKLRDKVKSTLKPFQDFGSPWDVQTANYSKLQISIIEQLKQKATKSEMTHLDLQEKINDEIVKLREEESVLKLDKRLTQASALLDKKIQKYKSDFDEDCKIIKKCKETVKKELTSMQNKIDKFLQINKPAEIRENCSLSSYQSAENCFCELNLEDFILQELRLIEKQINHFNFWRMMILKNMASYRPFMENEILGVVDAWQEELILEGSQFVDENLKAVEELREDICTKVYNVRLNELTEHQQKLERHKKMINASLNESSKCTDSFLDFSEAINDYKTEALKMIEEYGAKAKYSSQIKCLKNMLKMLKEDHKKKIGLRLNCSVDRLMKKISLIKMSNESLLNEIALFNNGGNFSTEELNLTKKEIDLLLKTIQKDELDNRSKIKKITDEVNFQIDDIEKTNCDSLNITLEKLRLQENINNAITKCEYVIGIRKKYFAGKNKEIIEMVVNFIQKCQNGLSANEIISDLTKLTQTTQKHFYFIKGPFPNIDIPRNCDNNNAQFNNSNNNITRGHSKRRISLVKTVIDVQKNITQNDQYDSNNFASFIVKLIRDTLTIINEKSVEYYSLLKNKREHDYFLDKNKSCEGCINNALQQLSSIYRNIFNFWIEEINEFLNAFGSVEMPSLDSYLNSEHESDKEESSQSFTTEDSNPNRVISLKIDENVMEFQNILQGMLNVLQSKSMDSVSEKVADDNERSN